MKNLQIKMSFEDVVFLNLPSLPEELNVKLAELCRISKISYKRYSKIKSYYDTKILIAAQEYDTEKIKKMPQDIIDQIQNLYTDFFCGGIYAFLGKAKNLYKTPCVTPPHCDRGRQVAINYLLNTGGSDVITSFYKEERKQYNLAKGESLNYDQVSVSSRIVIPERKWHAFNAQKYHSVENIQNERYYFSLLLYLNPDFETFKKKYNHLIIK